MSGALTTLVIVGAIGVALLKRCDWFQLCGSFSDIFGTGSSSTSGTSDDSSTVPGIDSATFKADKGKKCGCCKCHRTDGKTVHCITSNGDQFDFQNGLSLDAQCKACGSSASICPDEVAHAAENAAKNVPTTSTNKKTTGENTYKYTCAAGSHPNANGVCVSDNISAKKENKAKANPEGGGCKAGQMSTCTYNATLDKIVCKCLGSHYASALYSNQVNNYNMSRFARIAI